jgi:uncharacterized protein YqfA (UPF0365 family)
MILAQQQDSAIVGVIAALIGLGFFLFLFVFVASLLRPWLRAFLSGVPVSVLRILGMRLRGTPPDVVIDALVTLAHGGYECDSHRMSLAESTYLAQRGRIESAADLADIVEKQLKMVPTAK